MALSRTAADEIPRQFGPEKTCPVRADQPEQVALPLFALGADLRESGRDHADSRTLLEG